jgi:hypothetical protein
MCGVLNKHHAGMPAGAVYIGRGSKWAIRSGSAPTATAQRLSRNMSAGSPISISSCARSTGCAVAISSASVYASSLSDSVLISAG